MHIKPKDHDLYGLNYLTITTYKLVQICCVPSGYIGYVHKIIIVYYWSNVLAHFFQFLCLLLTKGSWINRNNWNRNLMIVVQIYKDCVMWSYHMGIPLSKNKHFWLIGDFNLSLGVSVHGYLSNLSLCGPVMVWRPIRGLACLSPNGIWNMLQSPATLSLIKWDGWMDEWMCDFLNNCLCKQS